MNQKDYYNQQGAGYFPQNSQNGSPSGAYPGGTQQQGYSAQPGYQPQQGNPAYQYSQGYQVPQNYQQAAGYQTPQATGYQPPQASGMQTGTNAYQDPSSSYIGQGSFSQNPYAQGYAQNAGTMGNTGYPQQGGYPQAGYQQTGYQQAPGGYTYPGGQTGSSGSYIPQTPYTQGYAATGYQQPAAGYSQGYNAYTQMGRAPQGQQNAQQDFSGQVPLNGGGYVPRPVPVRRRPLELTDVHLVIAGALLLVMFAIGMFVPGFGFLKWIFLALAVGTTAFLWIKPVVANNKRLCYTIIFALLSLVVLIGFITGLTGRGGSDGRQDLDSGRAATSVKTDGYTATEPTAQAPAAAQPSVTNTPEPENDNSITDRLQTFFYYWSANRTDDMITLCSPSWQSKVEDPKRALFGLLANRTPKDYMVESVSGTEYDTTRTVTVTSLMDRNNGKDPVRYRLSVIMSKENDVWYVDPQSLQTYENADTPDPSITATPAPTEETKAEPNTVLYYNPSGGEYYHLDPNCKKINERYLPLQGKFTYAEINKEPYSKLKPCAICGAPLRDQ